VNIWKLKKTRKKRAIQRQNTPVIPQKISQKSDQQNIRIWPKLQERHFHQFKKWFISKPEAYIFLPLLLYSPWKSIAAFALICINVQYIDWPYHPWLFSNHCKQKNRKLETFNPVSSVFLLPPHSRPHPTNGHFELAWHRGTRRHLRKLLRHPVIDNCQNFQDRLWTILFTTDWIPW